MRGRQTLAVALEAVRLNRTRSLLTILGIMIGIASVTLTVGLGLGAQQQVKDQISALGSNLLIVSPGSSTSGGVRGGFGSATTLTRADAEAKDRAGAHRRVGARGAQKIAPALPRRTGDARLPRAELPHCVQQPRCVRQPPPLARHPRAVACLISNETSSPRRWGSRTEVTRWIASRPLRRSRLRGDDREGAGAHQPGRAGGRPRAADPGRSGAGVD